MRSRRAWHRIIALLALVSLVLPASARVALCTSSTQKSVCCMAHKSVAKTKPVEETRSCCQSKAKVAPVQSGSSSVSEGKDRCHCVAKLAPTAPATLASITGGSELVEVTIPSQPESTPRTESVTNHVTTIFSGDSSPPDEPHGSSGHGRAPPVSIL